MNLLYNHLSVNQDGHLAIGGLDTLELAREFGTPAYVMDEDAIRSQMRTYLNAAHTYFGADALPLYASKALCFAGIYRIAAEEGMGVDCVSGGELYTAKVAGFPAQRIYFHGNNKTERDIDDAMDMGVGTFVVDNTDELESLEAHAAARGITQRILLRITPGIDPHTHKAIVTGSVDSKFGSAIETGQAMDIVKLALSKPHLHLSGFHCHIGSQIFDTHPFSEAADIMVRFIAAVKAVCGYEAEELNLGGGLGVPYTEYDRPVDYAAAIKEMADIVHGFCDALITSVPIFQEDYRLLCLADSSLPEGVVTPEMLDPSFEIAQTFPNQSLKKWHQEHFPDDPQPYASVLSTLTMFIHLTDKRCWAAVPTTIAMLIVQQNPGKFALRTLQPSPTRQHSISIVKGYPHSEVIDDLLACCREYLAERPYLHSLLPEDI